MDFGQTFVIGIPWDEDGEIYDDDNVQLCCVVQTVCAVKMVYHPAVRSMMMTMYSCAVLYRRYVQ